MFHYYIVNVLENYYKPIFGLFHLYIRVKCIIILYRRDGFGKTTYYNT